MEMEGAAELLHLHPNNIYKLIESGEIPATKIGNKWIFPTKQLLDHITNKAITEQKNRTLKKRKGGGRRKPLPEIGIQPQ